MISEDLLERGLGAAADAYDVPPAAVDELHDRITPRAAKRRRRRLAMTRRVWVLTTAAAVVAVAAIAIAVGGGGSGPNTRLATNGPARIDGAGIATAPAGGVGGAGVSGTAGSTLDGSLDSSAGGASGGSSSATGATGALAAVPAPKAVGSDGVGAVASPPLAFGSVHSNAQSAAGARTPSTLAAPSAPDGAKVVKTGEMDLQVDKGKVGSTLFRLNGIATLEGGYIADSQTTESGDPSGSVTLRVPVTKFEHTLQDVRQITGVKIVSQQTNGSDVTSKYVDLQAREHALVATRTTFERLLARATTIGDTLAVQSRITDVQTQIEQLQGQLRVLDDQTTFGTLTVTVDQRTAPAPVAHHQSGMSKAWHRSVSRFVHGIEAIVGILGPLLLVLLIVAAAVVAGRLGYRRLRRQLV